MFSLSKTFIISQVSRTQNLNKSIDLLGGFFLDRPAICCSKLSKQGFLLSLPNDWSLAIKRKAYKVGKLTKLSALSMIETVKSSKAPGFILLAAI